MRTTKTFLIAVAFLIALSAGSAFAVTVGDITDALENNYGNINDLTANLTVDSTDNDHDVTSGWIKAKQDSSDTAKGKFRVKSSAPSSGEVICDGDYVDDNGDQSTKTSWVTSDSSHIGWFSRGFRETDILWILDSEYFSLAGSNSTINSVTCKKIYSTDYDIYVDENEYAKIIRIDRKVSSSVVRRYDFSSYTYVESTAWVAGAETATDAPGANTETYDITYSNISINDNLPDSDFELP